MQVHQPVTQSHSFQIFDHHPRQDVLEWNAWSVIQDLS